MRRDRFLAIAVAFAVAPGCGRPDPQQKRTPVAIPDASVTDASVTLASTIMLMDDDETPRQARWTSTGDVLAISQRRLWRFSPDGAKVAKTTVLELGGTSRDWSHLAIARDVDVAVVSRGGKAFVVRGGAVASSFAVDPKHFVVALSDDGKTFVERGQGAMRVYDVATGVKRATVEGGAHLSPGAGTHLITHTGVHPTHEATDGGAVSTQVSLPATADWSRTAAWIGGRAVMWGERELAVVDPATATTKRLVADCKEDHDVRDFVDVVGRRAFRYCGPRLFVATLDAKGDPSLVEIPIPLGRTTPHIGIARDTGEIVFDWRAGPLIPRPKAPIELVDVGGKRKAIEVMPPLRDGMGRHMVALSNAGQDALRPNSGGAAPAEPSRDGRFLLLSVSGGGVAVLDPATAHEHVRWGPPSVAVGGGAELALFVHEGGLEVAAPLVGGAGPPPLRVGPARLTDLGIPRISPDSECWGQPGSATARRVWPREVLFLWSSEASCLCGVSGCKTSELAHGLLARAKERTLVQLKGGPQLEYLENASSKGLVNLEDIPVAAAFVDDAEKSAAIVVGSELLEASLPSLTIRRRHALPKLDPGGRQIATGGRSAVVWESTNTSLRAAVFTLGSDAPPILVDAWPRGALVRHPGGGLERFGEGVDGLVVCLEPDGTVRADDTCRARAAARTPMRVD